MWVDQRTVHQFHKLSAVIQLDENHDDIALLLALRNSSLVSGPLRSRLQSESHTINIKIRLHKLILEFFTKFKYIRYLTQRIMRFLLSNKCFNVLHYLFFLFLFHKKKSIRKLCFSFNYVLLYIYICIIFRTYYSDDIEMLTE